MLDNLRDGADTLAGSAQTLESILAPLPKEMQTLVDAVAQAGQQQADTTSAVQRAITELQALLTQLAAQSGQFQQLDQTLRDLGGRLADLGRQTQAHTSADRDTARARIKVIADLTQALQGVRQAITTIEADRQRTASRWSDEQSARDQVTKSLDSVAASVRESGRRFDQTTKTLETLVSQMRPSEVSPTESTTLINGPGTAPYGPSLPRGT